MRGFDDHLDNYGNPNPGDVRPLSAQGERHYGKDLFEEAIEMVTGLVGCQVFRNGDSEHPQALIIGNDSTWLARVHCDGSIEEAYLISEPVRDVLQGACGGITRVTDDDVEPIQGFTPGFTC